MEIHYHEDQEHPVDEFYIHNSSGDFLEEIQHPFHPHHCLTLQKPIDHQSQRAVRRCDACCFIIDKCFTYHCDECNFNLHSECASLKPNVMYKGHEHLLTLIENMSYESDCQACGLEIKGTFFVRCVECRLDFHVQCGHLPLPPTLVYKDHEHPLALCSNPLVKNDSDVLYCDACKKERNPDHPFYFCADCDYSTHVRCVTFEVSEVQFDDKEKLKHFSHRHVLILCENKDHDEDLCYACRNHIQGPAYNCHPCKFHLHKSCAELPEEIHHPFHRHSLTLQNFSPRYTLLECNACRNSYNGFSYTCLECNFDLDVNCASLRPSIKLECHRHLLTFFERLHGIRNCKARCQTSNPDTSYLRCVICNFNVHLRCSPLPETIKHKSHPHSLTLVNDFAEDDHDPTEYHCDDCRTKRESLESVYYYCEECFFVIYFSCVISEVILALTEASGEGTDEGGERDGEGEKMEIDSDILHEHSLTLCESDDEGEVPCPGCVHPLLDQSYACKECQFYPPECSCCGGAPSGSFYICKLCWPESPLFDKFCVELSSKGVKLSCHPHSSLHIQEESNSVNLLDCDFCKETDEDNNMCCAECNFQICGECLGTFMEYHEGREHVKHLSHRHSLTLLDVDDKKCMLCCGNINGPSYGCVPCAFHIHKSCYELPQDMRHPFHPRHCLSLQATRVSPIETIIGSPYHRCDACLGKIQGLKYQCDSCGFDLHLGCVLLKPNIMYKGHEHLLTLIENMSYRSNCKACGFKIEGTFFVRCVECRLDFHVQCGPLPLPSTVVHKQHEHTLTLSTETLVKDDFDQICCDSCKKERDPDHPFYFCAECDYSTHVRCAVTEVPFDGKGKLEHFSHQHIMKICEKEKNDEDFCCACENRIQRPAYSCDPCKLYLHESCAKLPREIQHPFHQHPLTLPQPYSAVASECNACHKHCYGFTYSCYECNFYLDLDCSLLKPSIKFEGHGQHILALFEKLYDVPECIANCNFTSPDASYLRCVKCNFNIHLTCSPLPQTIEHESHHHFLTLMDSFVDDDYDEYVCDICEEIRDPQECVYYCAECYFIAEFNCAKSQVIMSLQKEPRDVQLRTVKREIPDKLIIKGSTLKDEFELFTEEGEKKIDDMIELIQKEWKDIRKALPKVDRYDDDDVSISKKYSYSDDVFSLFMVRLFYRNKKKKVTDGEFWDMKAEVVHVGDHAITRSLAPVLKKLLDKHPNSIDVNCSSLTQRLKMAFLVMFCWAVQSMCETQVMDITDILILKWHFCIQMVLRAGFRIQFAYDHLKRIAYARYGIEDEIYRNSNLYEHYQKMFEISQDIDKLTKELKELRKQTRQVISTHHSERSRSEVNRFSEALELRMKNAGAGLL